eukprot:CAMPEP_0185756832 /NCGR_PEP_ID=MMETSP1174-20130828/15229_1 /TAXON_ID=35687 /ORGANISM="Dictyocha speculum, Strain CCMP1381" /LENGTH=132 /DNA_ID=CAMNT_0028435959 /DNA_START=141 /DNA_END=540 /DNA_ORIENTATION=-
MSLYALSSPARRWKYRIPPLVNSWALRSTSSAVVVVVDDAVVVAAAAAAAAAGASLPALGPCLVSGSPSSLDSTCIRMEASSIFHGHRIPTVSPRDAVYLREGQASKRIARYTAAQGSMLERTRHPSVEVVD